MNYKALRQVIRDRTDTDTDIVQILNILGINVSREDSNSQLSKGDSNESRETI